MGLRITSWNVNGIRNPFAYQPWRENKTYQAMFDTLEADIVVMQETKIQRKDLQDDMVLVPGWDVYFSLPKFKKGYSGVAIYTRNSRCCPIRAEEGITGVLCPPNSTTRFRDLPTASQIGGYPRPGQLAGDVDEATLDSEGRCVILEFPAFVLIGVYSPATRDETRTEFRLGFQAAMDARVRNLVAMGKHVVLTGDLNIIRGELDTAGLLDRLRKEDMSLDDFFSSPPRRLLNHLVFDGTVVGARDEGREAPAMHDLGREFHPTRQGMYTCWETRKNARPGNFGSRIDYVLCSAGIRSWFVDAGIQEGLLGSDHCPVYAIMDDIVQVGGKAVHVIDVMNPEGMFRDGERLRDWSAKDLLSLSARLIPDFDRRRSIKDMFSKRSLTSLHKQTPTNPSAATPTETRSVPWQQQQQSQMPDRTTGVSNNTPLSPPSAVLPSSSKATLQKRPTEVHISGVRPQKKIKAPLGKDTASKSSERSQTSLRGFFRPKEPAPTRLDEKSLSSVPDLTAQTATPSYATSTPSLSVPKDHREDGQVNASDAAASGTDYPTKPRQFSPSAISDKVFDPIESKESWSKLLGKRVAPRCEHGDPCISLMTKKPGVNCGRSFYMCGRPLGPSGEKEKDTEWRCGTFIWSSDWVTSK